MSQQSTTWCFAKETNLEAPTCRNPERSGCPSRHLRRARGLPLLQTDTRKRLSSPRRTRFSMERSGCPSRHLKRARGRPLLQTNERNVSPIAPSYTVYHRIVSAPGNQRILHDFSRRGHHYATTSFYGKDLFKGKRSARMQRYKFQNRFQDL
jgi:hypothetical protein